MAFTAFRDMKPFSQLFFTAFVILVSFFAFMILSFIVAIPLFGMDSILNLPGTSDLNNPESLAVLKFFQIVQSIGLFIIPPFILAYLFQGKIFGYLYLNKSFDTGTVLLILILMFASNPLINFIGELNSSMSFPSWMAGIEQWMKNAEENAALITEAFLNVETIPALAFNLFMVALLPAIGEELLFRGVIQKIFTKMTRNHHWGIWISAILFSALHMQFYGFVPRMLLGALFGYFLVWSGSMWLPIIAHFINNAIGVTGMFLIHNPKISPEFEEYGTSNDSYYMAALSIAFVIVFLVLIKKQNTGKTIPVSN